MTTRYLRALHQRAADPAGADADAPLRFIASTENVARDGLVIEAAGWQLDNYRANPVVLWAHDYWGQHTPIGRATVEVADKALLAEITFDRQDPFAADIERKYRQGFLNAVSVGWDTLEFAPSKGGLPPRITKAELLDISAVPVPGDPGALKERQLRGLAQIEDQLAAVLQDAGGSADGEIDWEATAIGMMRLLDPATQMPEHDRKRAYNRLEARYRKLGRTAPELLPLERLQALGAAELRGLYLESEPELWPGLFTDARAGAVLNKRNRERLGQIRDLAQAVLDSAEPPDQEADADAERTGADPDADLRQRTAQAALLKLRDQLNQFKL